MANAKFSAQLTRNESNTDLKSDRNDTSGQIFEMEHQKQKMQNDIDQMQKQLLMLNNDIKSKSTLLDKVKKAKPGAPAPRPPAAPTEALQPKHESVA